MKQIQYLPSGTCSRKIEITLADDGTIADIVFIGGCPGNLQGISALCRGRKPAEVAGVLRGLRCGTKETSCPDQLARALELSGENQG